MSQAFFLFLLLVLPFALGAVFPARAAARFAILVVLCLIALWTLSPATPWLEQGNFHIEPRAILTTPLGLMLLGAGIRVWIGWPDTPDPGPITRAVDLVLSVLAGLLAATLATLFLASALRGSTGGLPLHLALSAGAATLAGIALWLTRGVLRTGLAATLATMAVLILWGGLAYPDHILASARQKIVPDAPRCLRTGPRAPLPDELRLLTLPQAMPFNPGLILTVMTDRGPRHFRWSYRSVAFRSYESYPHGACPADLLMAATP